MKITDLIIFTVILTICICFFRFLIEQTIKKYFKDLNYDTEQIKIKFINNLECDIISCREDIKKVEKEFESIQEELNIINEKLVVGKGEKSKKICQLVDEKKELEEEIERLNKINQEFARDYWDRLNSISIPYYPLVTPRPWGHF